MPAGVHLALGAGAEVDVDLLGHRQGVHVAAQQHHRALAVGGRRAAAAQHTGDRRRARARADLEIEPLQRLQHRGLGGRQHQADLRGAVQGVPQVRDVGGRGGGVLEVRAVAAVRGRHSGHRTSLPVRSRPGHPGYPRPHGPPAAGRLHPSGTVDTGARHHPTICDGTPAAPVRTGNAGTRHGTGREVRHEHVHRSPPPTRSTPSSRRTACAPPWPSAGHRSATARRSTWSPAERPPRLEHDGGRRRPRPRGPGGHRRCHPAAAHLRHPQGDGVLRRLPRLRGGVGAPLRRPRAAVRRGRARRRAAAPHRAPRRRLARRRRLHRDRGRRPVPAGAAGQGVRLRASGRRAGGVGLDRHRRRPVPQPADVRRAPGASSGRSDDHGAPVVEEVVVDADPAGAFEAFTADLGGGGTVATRHPAPRAHGSSSARAAPSRSSRRRRP